MAEPNPAPGARVSAGDAGAKTTPESGRPIFSGLPAPVRQRAALVLPSTAEFDSRAYRIASALVARGHDVVVLARWRPGLPEDEQHPAGYRIRRVKVSAGSGLPLPDPVLRTAGSWRRRRRDRSAAASLGAANSPVAAPSPAVATRPAATSPPAAASPLVAATALAPSGSPAHRRPAPLSRLTRLPGAFRRVAAIALVVRSQVKASRRLGEHADLYHGMAYMGIPVALDLAGRFGGRAVYDARDIYMDAGNLARLPRPARSVVGRLERGWARRAARVITVNRPYAEVMAQRFGVELPLVVLNCSYRFDPPAPPRRRFHEALGLAADIRVVLYQGGFARDRGIEQLIAAIPSIDGAVLVLLGYGPLLAELVARAADPALGGRLRVLPAVPPGELLGWVAAADVVAMPIQPTTLNHRLTTPNKLFEAMAAGVPVVASDLPGMAGIVRESGCGLLVDPTDPAAIAGAIRAILDAPEVERRAFGERALAAAHATYNWERQMERLLAEYGRLTGAPW